MTRMLESLLNWLNLTVSDLPFIVIGASVGLLIGIISGIWGGFPGEGLSPMEKLVTIRSMIRKEKYILLVPVFSLTISIFYISLSEGYFNSALVYMDQYSSIFSLILSAMLVILYGIQHRSLQRQINIVNKQVDYARADHKPEIIIEEWEVDGDKVRLTLSNIGNGTAKNLSFSVAVSYLSDEGQMKIARTNTGPLPKPVYREGTSKKIDYLKPDEEHIVFSTEAMVPQTWKEGVKSPVPFSEALHRFQNLGSEGEQPKVFVRPMITFENIAGEENNLYLISEVVNSTVISDFEDAMATSYKLGLGGDFHPPENHIIHKDVDNYDVIINSEEYLKNASAPNLPYDAIEYTEPP